MSLKRPLELFLPLLALVLSCMPEKRVFYPPLSEQQLKEVLFASNKAYGEGKATEVVSMLEPLIDRFPQGPLKKEALKLLAFSYFSLKRYEKSSLYFQELLGSFPESGRDKSITLQAIRSFEKAGETHKIPPLAEGLLKTPLSSEEKKEVLKILAKSLGRINPVKALKNYELLQKEGVSEARQEAFSLIEECSREQLIEVEKAFSNHPFGVLARITLARLHLKEGQPAKAFFALETLRDKAKEKGVLNQWQKAWNDVRTEVKSQVLRVRMFPDGKRGLDFLKGAFLAGGVFGERVPWKMRLKFERSPEDTSGTLLFGVYGFEKGIKGLLELAKREGLTELALIGPGGERLKEVVSKAAKAQGLEVLRLGPDDKDKKEKAKGLLLVGEEKDICSVLAQGEGKGPKVFVLLPKDPSGLLRVCGRYMEGAFLACPFWESSTRDGVREFVQGYRSVYGESPSFQAALGYFEVIKALDPSFRSPLEDPFLLKVTRGSALELR